MNGGDRSALLITSIHGRRCRGPAYLLIAGLAFFAACQADVANRQPDPAAHTTVAAQRVFDMLQGDTVAIIGLDDSTLLDPGPTAVAQGGIAILDYGDSKLKMFDPAGALKWSAGRRGEGPGEWLNPVDVEIDAGGHAWIADGGTGRITVLDETGAFVRTWSPSGNWLLSRLVLLDSGSFVIVTTAGPTFWIEVDSGEVLRSQQYLEEELRTADAQRRTVVVATHPARDLWVAVHILADLYHVYDGRDRVCRGRLARGSPMDSPPVPRGTMPPIWAASATFLDSTFLVLARDLGSDDDLTIIDEYAAADCRYVRSFRWTKRLRSVSASDSMLYLEEKEPSPRLVILRSR